MKAGKTRIQEIEVDQCIKELTTAGTLTTPGEGRVTRVDLDEAIAQGALTPRVSASEGLRSPPGYGRGKRRKPHRGGGSEGTLTFRRGDNRGKHRSRN